MNNVDVVKQHYAASDRGDLEGMLGPLAADVVWTEAARTRVRETWFEGRRVWSSGGS